MLAVLLSTLLVAGPSESSLRSLEGDWAVERMEQKGKRFPTDLTLKVRLQVRGDIFTFANGQTEFSSKVTKLDASGEPRAIDLTRDSDKQTVRGIYKLDGDTLTVCSNARGERPKDFAATPDSPNVLTVYKRAPAAAR